MQPRVSPTPTRPQTIADAAIRIIAREGLRALTHRSTDREAGLPPGSCSYYAGTRAALIQLVGQRLAERSMADLHRFFDNVARIEPISDPDGRLRQLARVIADFADSLLARPADMRARYALAMDFLEADPLSDLLSAQSPLLADSFSRAPDLLRRFGIAATPAHGRDIMLLTDALTFSRTLHASSPQLQLDVEGVVLSHLRSLPTGAVSDDA
ncbi:TetR/AcrR family transcriptional regulator [Microbacterium hydrocarbonoxydans]|nr:TetR family transcriptional regulator [Microbacterium hydrocarbonoxydans]